MNLMRATLARAACGMSSRFASPRMIFRSKDFRAESWPGLKGCGVAGRRVRPVRPGARSSGRCEWREEDRVGVGGGDVVRRGAAEAGTGDLWVGSGGAIRSEEHTSELQSLRHLVCRL